MTIEEVGQLVGRSVRTLHGLQQDGSIPPRPADRNYTLEYVATVRTWLEDAPKRRRLGQENRGAKGRKRQSRSMRAAWRKKLADCAALAAKLAAEHPLTPEMKVGTEEAASRMGVNVQLLRSWISLSRIPGPAADGLYTGDQVMALIKWKQERPKRVRKYQTDLENKRYAEDRNFKARKLAAIKRSRAKLLADAKLAREKLERGEKKLSRSEKKAITRLAKLRKRKRKNQQDFRATNPGKSNEWYRKLKQKLAEAERILADAKGATEQIGQLKRIALTEQPAGSSLSLPSICGCLPIRWRKRSA